MSNLYDDPKEARSQFGKKRRDFERYARELLNYLPAGSGRTLLDIGCGAGFLVAEANRRGFKACGIDASKVLTRLGKEKLKANLQAVSIEKYKTNQKFDVLVAKHVIEHIEDLDSFLAQCHQLLKPHGLFLISCPNIRSLFYFIFRKRWYGLQPDQHRWQFTPKLLTSVLEKNGFKIVKAEVTNLNYQVPGPKRPIFWFLLALAKLTNLGDQLIFLAKKN